MSYIVHVVSYSITLHYIVLYCISLYVVCFPVLYCIILLYYILDCIVLFLCTLHCGLYYCFVLFWNVSYCFLLFICPYSTYFVISCYAQGHFHTSFKSFHVTSHHVKVLFYLPYMLCCVLLWFSSSWQETYQLSLPRRHGGDGGGGGVVVRWWWGQSTLKYSEWIAHVCGLEGQPRQRYCHRLPICEAWTLAWADLVFQPASEQSTRHRDMSRSHNPCSNSVCRTVMNRYIGYIGWRVFLEFSCRPGCNHRLRFVRILEVPKYNEGCCVDLRCWYMLVMLVMLVH